jgi:hypothetical protein
MDERQGVYYFHKRSGGHYNIYYVPAILPKWEAEWFAMTDNENNARNMCEVLNKDIEECRATHRKDDTE